MQLLRVFAEKNCYGKGTLHCEHVIMGLANDFHIRKHGEKLQYGKVLNKW